ncbi:putative transcription factor C2H2 family [Helianthus annuus]|nr:putative transcription factor C2H2 family [Helianthus annuus]
MASPEKRCLYEVLNLPRDCTADEIRSAYRKLALQRHPDKLIKSGIPESEATASFQELVNAYEVLSDARERAWYDSHRSQILFSGTTSSSSAVVPDLFTFFSNSVYSGFSDKGKGFYKVYGDVFDKIYMNELNYAKRLGLGNVVKEAPVMGNLESVYEQVNAFYGYWLGFVTVMDFVWADEYDVMSGPNRKSRRLMEEENKKIRKRARREYIETVRGLAEFVDDGDGRRKRRGRKETAKRDEYEEEQERIDKPEISSKAEVDEKREDGLHTEEPSCADNENNGGGDDGPAGKSKVSKQAPAVKVTSKKEAKSKAKNLPKGKKQKATSRNSGNECDTCGADFDSRTKLHKHLNDTGHATIKSR